MGTAAAQCPSWWRATIEARHGAVRLLEAATPDAMLADSDPTLARALATQIL